MTDWNGWYARSGAVLVHVQPREVSLVAILLRHDRDGAERAAEDRRAEDVADLRARHEEHREREEQEHDRAAEVRLLHAQEHEDAGDEEVREEADGEGLHLLGLLRERVGEPRDERELRHLGRLDVHRTDREPARRAAAAVTEADDAQRRAGAPTPPSTGYVSL